MQPTVTELLESAVAILSQKKTFPADAALAKDRIIKALSQLTPRAADYCLTAETHDWEKVESTLLVCRHCGERR